MPDKSWKAFERRIAARHHGGQRIPVTGERAGSDIVSDMFCIQAKLRKRMPTFLSDWLDGIRAAAAKHGKIGIVIWKTPGRHDDNAVVLLSLKDWQDLHGKVCYTAAAADDEPPYERD